MRSTKLPRTACLRSRQPQGFVLVEMMIASFILAFAFVTLFSAVRLGDWQNIQSRIQSRLGRVTRRYADFIAYAPYDRLAGGELETGFLYQPVDTRGRRDFPFYPDPQTTPYLDRFPYRVECAVQIVNPGQSSEYKQVSLQVYYTGQNGLATNAPAVERLFYDNGGQLIRSRY